MSPRLLALLAGTLLVAGVVGVGHATLRLASLDRESAGLAATGRAAGDSFVATLQGENASRELATFDRQRALALTRAGARRARLLWLLAAVAGGMGLVAARVFSRIAAEIEANQRELSALEGGPHPGPDPSGTPRDPVPPAP